HQRLVRFSLIAITDLSATAGRIACRSASASGTGATAAAGTAQCWHWIHAHAMVGVGVDDLIPNSVPVLVDPPHRLLEQSRLRVAFRHRAFHDVELVLVHADVSKRAGLIAAVGQLYEMSFNHVLPFPIETCQFGLALKELERRINNRSPLILLPVTGADDADIISTALLVTGGT